MKDKWTTAEVQAAVDELVREDDYSPKDAQARIAELLVAARREGGVSHG